MPGDDVERPAAQHVDAAQEADVLGFHVLLDVHEDVDEVVALDGEQLHRILAGDGGGARAAVHQRQLLRTRSTQKTMQVLIDATLISLVSCVKNSCSRNWRAHSHAS